MGDAHCTLNTTTWNCTETCNYVADTAACRGGGYLKWAVYVFCCESAVGQWFIAAAGVVFLLLLFIMLSTAADDFFCPNIATIVNKLRITENLAGVTFMAFGNGAPDVFTSLASVVTSPTPRADLALGSLMGAAIFDTLVVAALIVLIKEFKAAIWSSLRDLAFFIVTMCFILLFFLVSDNVQLWQPLVCLAIYTIYVLTILTAEYIKKRKWRSEELARSDSSTPNPTEDAGVETYARATDESGGSTRSSPSTSRRSVLIPSFTGYANEIVIENAVYEEDGSDFIITEHDIANLRHKPTINHLREFFTPQFEDEEPTKVQRAKTYFLFPLVTLFKATVPLSSAPWSKPVAILLAALAPQCFLFNTKREIR